MILQFSILFSLFLSVHSYFPWLCGCNYAIGCFDDASCCAGLVCISSSGFSQCQENPVYRKPSNTVPPCLQTSTDWGCRRNSDCCNPAAICGPRKICIFNQTCTMSYRSALPSGLPTSQPTSTPTINPSSPSSQPTLQPFRHPTRRPSHQPVAHPSKQPNLKPTQQPTSSPSTPSSQPSEQPINQPTEQPSSNPSQPSSQPSQQPSKEPSQQPASRPSRQPTAQPKRKPSVQPAHSPTTNPTCQPNGGPTAQPFSFPTRQPGRFPTSKPSCTPSLKPSSQPLILPSALPSKQPMRRPSSQPITRPSSQPTVKPRQKPSQQPWRLPTIQPSSRPHVRPSVQPIRSPSVQPTLKPTISPSSQPSQQPLHNPTDNPSQNPTMNPRCVPSAQPSRRPTQQPSDMPTSNPSQPTQQPIISPSALPSQQPSRQPNRIPTRQPLKQPSRQPSKQPIVSHPTGQPVKHPSNVPSRQPRSHPSRKPSVSPSSKPSSKPIVLAKVVPLSWYKNPVFGIATGAVFGGVCFIAAFYGFAVLYFKKRADKKQKSEKLDDKTAEKNEQHGREKQGLNLGEEQTTIIATAPTPESTENCQCVSDLYPQDKLNFSTDQVEWVNSSEQLMGHYTSKKFVLSSSKHGDSDDEGLDKGGIPSPVVNEEDAADTVQRVITRQVVPFCEPENSDSEASIIEGGQTDNANCSFSQLYQEYNDEGKAAEMVPVKVEELPEDGPKPPEPTIGTLFSKSASVDMTQIYSKSTSGISREFHPYSQTDAVNSENDILFSFPAADATADSDFKKPFRLFKSLLTTESTHNAPNATGSNSKPMNSPSRSPLFSDVLDSSKQEPVINASSQISQSSTPFGECSSTIQESTNTVILPQQKQPQLNRPISSVTQKAENMAALLEKEAKTAELNMFDIYPEDNAMNSHYGNDGIAESVPSPKRTLFQQASPSSVGAKIFQSMNFISSPPQASPATTPRLQQQKSSPMSMGLVSSPPQASPATTPRMQQQKSSPMSMNFISSPSQTSPATTPRLQQQKSSHISTPTQSDNSPDSHMERVPSVDKPLVNSKVKSPQRAITSSFARSIVNRMTTPTKQSSQAVLSEVTAATKPTTAVPNTPPSIALERTILSPSSTTVERSDHNQHSERFKETRMLFENYQKTSSLSSSQNSAAQVLSGVKVLETKQKFETLIEKNVGTPMDLKKSLKANEYDIPSADLSRPRIILGQQYENENSSVGAVEIVPPLMSKDTNNAKVSLVPITRSRSFSSRSHSPSSLKSQSHLYFEEEDVSRASKNTDTGGRTAAEEIAPPEISPYEAYKRLKLTLLDSSSAIAHTSVVTKPRNADDSNPQGGSLSTPLLEIKSLSALQDRAKAAGDFRIQSMMTNHSGKEKDFSTPNAKKATAVLDLSEVSSKQRLTKLGHNGESVNDMYEKILQTYFSPTTD